MEKKERILELVNHCGEAPKVTIMMPTSRKSPDNKKDKILFKNLIQKCRTVLEKKYSPPTYEKMLEKLYALHEDTMFWAYSKRGLVVLGSNENIETFKLNRDVKEEAKVSQVFDLRPIMAYEESIGIHYLVDLAKDRFKIYTISDKEINEMADHEIKDSFTQLFDDFDFEGNLNVGSYGGLQGMYHGHRDKSEEKTKDRNRFFRYLHKEFTNLHKENQSHFFFAGTKENIAAFKKLAQEDFYHDLAIEQPLSSMNHNKLDEKIESITNELKHDAIQKLSKEINDAYNKGKVIKDRENIFKAMKEGRLAKLYIKGNVSYSNNYDEILYEALTNNVEPYVIYSDEIELEKDLIAVHW